MSGRSLALLAAIALGWLIEPAQAAAWLIRYLLMIMLFLAFIGNPPPRRLGPYRTALGMVVFLLTIGTAAFATVQVLGAPDLAALALLLGVTPTATAAPTVTRLLGRDVRMVAANVLVTNGLLALILPWVLPLLDPPAAAVDTAPLCILGVVLVPVATAEILRHWGSPRLLHTLLRLQPVAFHLWLAVVFLSTAAASHQLREYADAPWILIGQITLIAGSIGLVSVLIGLLVGGRHRGRETAQSLGQKNTMLATWIALTYLTPPAAIAPVVYLILQNLANAWLLARSPRATAPDRQPPGSGFEPPPN